MANAVIVVVEDNTPVARIVREILTEVAGYQAIVAPDGARALEIIAARRPDLVILDVDLPDINGFVVYDRLHSRPETTTLPCLFMSAWRDSAELARRGIRDFLPKPFDLQELLDRVDALLQRAAAGDRAM
jgi:DNA-binding response OmpR family regulator